MSGSNNNDDNDENSQRRNRGSWLNPFDYLPSFSFFSLLFMVAIGLGIYYLGWTERGRQMLGQGLSQLPDDWQSTVAGWLLPTEINAAINPDAATFTRFRDIVTAAGGNLMDTDSLYTPEVLFAVMRDAPDIAQSLIRAIPAPGSANATDASRETNRKVMGAVRGIVGNPQMMATLFDAQHRTGTLGILDAMGRRSISYLPEGRLAQFIERVGFNRDGQPTPPLTQLLNAMMLSDDVAAQQAAIGNFVGRADPAARRELLAGVDHPAARFLRDATPRELQAALAIRADVGGRGASFEVLMNAMATPQGQVRLMLNPHNLDFLAPNLGRMGIMAQERAGNDHYSAGQRQFYAFLGTSGTDAQGRPNRAVNMAATMRFFRDAGSNPHNMGAGAARARHVITGMLGLISGDRAAAGRLDAAQVAAFFQDERNVNAFHTLLHSIHPDRLPPNMLPVISALRDYWSGRADGQNVSEVMAHEPSVAMLLHGIRESLTNPNAQPIIISDQSRVRQLYARWMPSRINLPLVEIRTGAPPSEIGENLYAMQAIQDALLQAGVIHRPAAAPAAPSTPRHNSEALLRGPA